MQPELKITGKLPLGLTSLLLTRGFNPVLRSRVGRDDSDALCGMKGCQVSGLADSMLGIEASGFKPVCRPQWVTLDQGLLHDLRGAYLFEIYTPFSRLDFAEISLRYRVVFENGSFKFLSPFITLVMVWGIYFSKAFVYR